MPFSLSPGRDVALRARGLLLFIAAVAAVAWFQPFGVSTAYASDVADSADALDAGEYFTCARYENGELHCWGENTATQNAAPQGRYGALSVGFDHACALRGSGQIVCWGYPGTIATPPPTGSYIALSAGNTESCAIRSDAQLRCWGGAMAEAAPTTGDFIAVGVAAGRGCAIRSDGQLQCWQAAGVTSLGTPPVGRYLAVSLGTSHACALRSDGKVQCWGSNAQGQTAAPSTGNFIAVASGHQHACAIDETGAIACWGANPSGQTNAPIGRFNAISAGRLHTCARDEEGSVQCWGGGGSRGELNAPTYSFQSLAVGLDQACGLVYEGNVACAGATSALTPPVRRYNALSFGETTACGLTVDGRVECWGASPGAAPSEPLMAIAVGKTHVCALRVDGSPVCWGDNSFGQATPVPGEYQTIVSGERFSCGLGRNDGRVHCWGQGAAVANVPQNEYFYQISASGANVCGRAGMSNNYCWGDDAALLQPPAVPLLDIAVGARHACGIRLASDPAIVCWGDNARGQLQSPPGMGFYRLAAFADTTCTHNDFTMRCWGAQTLTRKSPGVRFARGAIAAGEAHTCTVRGYRGVGCWGDNAFGQRNPPIQRAQALSAYGDHACTVRGDGQLACWGDNTHNGATPPAGAMRALDAGHFNGCAVRGAGTLACWGWNVNDQSFPPPDLFRSIATGLNHSCGLRDDGSLNCWGYNADGQATAPTGVFRFVDVGERHSCAIAIDGSLRCWGLGSEGQATPPDLPGARYRALAVGAFHNCAILSNGAIACWGRNTDGQATAPEEGQYVAIAAGAAHTCAIRDDGARVCWGANGQGQAPQVSIGPASPLVLTNEDPAQIDFTLSGSGGYVPPAPKFRILSGGFPFNLYLNEYGQVRGTPGDEPGNYQVTIEASDENGFVAVKDFQITLNRAPDVTPPSIQPRFNGSDLYAEWFNTDVRLEWLVTDPETSVTSTTGCTTTTVNTDTDGIDFTCTASSEGGTATRTVTIRRDTVAPQTAFDGPQPPVFYTWTAGLAPDVRFTFVAPPDDRSGVAGFECAFGDPVGTFFNCTSPLITAFGVSDNRQRVHVRAKDRAGNVDPTPAVHDFYVRVDSTRPVVTPLLTGTLGDDGWYVSDVQLRWRIEDPETPITFTEGCRDRDITTDTTGIAEFCRARSLPGETIEFIGVKRDTVAPTVIANPGASANAAGWYRQDVPVAYTCVEVTSGLATLCPGTESITQEGRNVSSVARTARDRAGHVGTSNVVTVNLDKTPPVTTRTPTTQPNAAGWYRNDVVIDFTCADALSGLAAPCTPQMTVTTEGSNNPGEMVYDHAGNSAFTGGLAIFIDKTAPTITAFLASAANSAGWYRTDVAVLFNCSDALSGLATPCPTSQIINQEGTGLISTAQTISDRAGNTAQSATFAVNIDKTAPTMTVTMPPATLVLNATHDFNLSASDALSGISSASCNPVNTATLGTRSVTCTAVDRAGNTVSRSASYRVIYDFVPLSAPLTDPAQLYQVTAPRSVPFEWRLRDANGTPILNATLTQTAVVEVACPSTGVPLATPPAGETTTFQNFGNGRYLRNWWIGYPGVTQCLRLDVTLNDGITRSATIRVVPKIVRTGGPLQATPASSGVRATSSPAVQTTPPARVPANLRRPVGVRKSSK